LKLYEISDEIERILIQEVDVETGAITDDAAIKLDALELRKEDVVIYIGRVIKGERLEGQAVKIEAQSLMKRAKVHENRADWLMGYLDKYTDQADVFKDATCIVDYAKSTAVKVLVDQEKDPQLTGVEVGFVKEQTTISVDKAKALKALRDGASIRGLELETRHRLRVR
jgi:hypothetical protein